MATDRPACGRRPTRTGSLGLHSAHITKATLHVAKHGKPRGEAETESLKSEKAGQHSQAHYKLNGFHYAIPFASPALIICHNSKAWRPTIPKPHATHDAQCIRSAPVYATRITNPQVCPPAEGGLCQCSLLLPLLFSNRDWPRLKDDPSLLQHNHIKGRLVAELGLKFKTQDRM